MKPVFVAVTMVLGMCVAGCSGDGPAGTRGPDRGLSGEWVGTLYGICDVEPPDADCSLFLTQVDSLISGRFESGCGLGAVDISHGSYRGNILSMRMDYHFGNGEFLELVGTVHDSAVAGAYTSGDSMGTAHGSWEARKIR